MFSRVGSREALQKAVIEEFGRRFLADVFVPAMQQPKGLPRLDEIVGAGSCAPATWRSAAAASSAPAPSSSTTARARCATCCSSEVTRWRAALRRTVLQAIEAGHLRPDTDPEQLVSEINALITGPDARRPLPARPARADRAQATWRRLLATYRA